MWAQEGEKSQVGADHEASWAHGGRAGTLDEVEWRVVPAGRAGARRQLWGSRESGSARSREAEKDLSLGIF